ncbi:MAG: ATP synthase F1 subunit gamma [Nannocystaceae bacterium]
MANLKEIRTRIVSVKNTRKITSAMSKIAAARLRRAQNTMARAQAYGDRVANIVTEVLSDVPDDAHRYLVERKVQRVALVTVTADRGLCGGFNTNIGRTALAFIEERQEAGQRVLVTSVGKKAATFLRGKGHSIDTSHPAPNPDNAVEVAAAVAVEVMTAFDDGEEAVDEVVLIYNKFKNVLTQEVTQLRLLPVPRAGSIQLESPAPTAQRAFEPDVVALLGSLLPLAIETHLQQAMFHSAAAEIAARRAAMDSATNNASGMIDELTLAYNRERQAAITTELMEIIGGSEALKA